MPMKFLLAVTSERASRTEHPPGVLLSMGCQPVEAGLVPQRVGVERALVHIQSDWPPRQYAPRRCQRRPISQECRMQITSDHADLVRGQGRIDIARPCIDAAGQIGHPAKALG